MLKGNTHIDETGSLDDEDGGSYEEYARYIYPGWLDKIEAKLKAALENKDDSQDNT